MSVLILAETVGAALLVTGSLIIAIAGIGLVRLGDPFMRMHAATKAGVVGAGLVMLGAGIATGTLSGTLTGLAGLAFLFFTAPIASHVLGRAAYIAGAPITPATVQDALAGVLPRNVFDIDPARTVRRPRISKGETKEEIMSAVQIRSEYVQSNNIAADPRALRRITAWLVGGDRQDEALQVTFDLSRVSGAALTGLSAVDTQAGIRREAVPAGGIYWSARLARHRRQQLRSRSAEALSQFNKLSEQTGIPANSRHEEGTLSDTLVALSGSDLVVTPAGVDRLGAIATYKNEVASEAAASHTVPVLRVNRRPANVGKVALLVDGGSRSQHLAQGLLRCGLYPGAAVTIIPVGAQAEKTAAEQQALLQAHGREVTIMETINLSDSADAMWERFVPFDVVAMTTLSARAGWFAQMREDAHEVAADTVPMTLLL
jgi:monovalent cation/proton antiporter MnhG/PhaG subunit